jgi:hypothetical protein
VRGEGQSLRFSLTRLIAEGIILLPEHGAAELIIQLVNFGAEESGYSRADTRQRKPMLRVQISRYDRGEVSLKAELLFRLPDFAAGIAGREIIHFKNRSDFYVSWLGSPRTANSSA